MKKFIVIFTFSLFVLLVQNSIAQAQSMGGHNSMDPMGSMGGHNSMDPMGSMSGHNSMGAPQ